MLHIIVGGLGTQKALRPMEEAVGGGKIVVHFSPGGRTGSQLALEKLRI